MNRFFNLGLLFATLLVVGCVSVNVDSEAKRRAERLMIRQERNTVDFTANLHGSLTAFSKSWQAAGDNTITVLANLNFLHTYKQGRFTLTNTAAAKFGYNNTKIDLNGEQKGVWFKNVDEIALSTSPQWALVKNWSYGANVKFRTQFAPGYEARGDKQLGNQRSGNIPACSPPFLNISTSAFTNSHATLRPASVARSSPFSARVRLM